MTPIFFRGALLASLSLLVVPACATHHPGPYHDWDGHYRDTRGYGRAWDRGYDHGVEAGHKDWRSRRRFDLSRHGRYRSGDSGYSSRYGPRSYYCRDYRAGFQAGYQRAYGPSRGRGHGSWSHGRRY